MPARRAIITGITGQDGSYLAELLLEAGYEVHGLARPSPTAGTLESLPGVLAAVELHVGDLQDSEFLAEVLRASQPSEIYNLAAMSSASESWVDPVLAGKVNGLGTTRILEAVKETSPGAHFFQASSAEIFGAADESPQSEATPIRPTSPYGAAKAYAQFVTAAYREKHGLFSCSGILYNHESPRRKPEFVTRKVTRGAAAIKLGLADHLSLGNLESQRDWGFAGDYAEAMWLMLQQEEPDDYVIATGEAHTVGDLVQIAFEHLGLDPERHVRVEPSFLRPTEGRVLIGDSAKARRELNWRPKVGFEQLIREMVDGDLETMSMAGTGDLSDH